MGFVLGRVDGQIWLGVFFTEEVVSEREREGERESEREREGERVTERERE